MEYLIKSILCLLLLLLFHRLILQQEVLYRFNRFFLLAAVIGSFLIPLVTLEVKQEVDFASIPLEAYSGEISSAKPNQEDTDIPVLAAENSNTAAVQIPWEEIGWSLYGIGVLVFLVRFLRNLRLIYQKIQGSYKVTYRNETLVLLPVLGSPFSFLNYIFYSKNAFEKDGIPEAIFLHEQCHVGEKHTWDVLLIEALLVVFWFHPGLYLARQAVKLNHEFIADQQVIKQFPVKDYQYLLMSILSGKQEFALGSSLNFPLTKKRFEMMKKTSKPGIQVLKVTALVVFLGVTVILFAEKVAVSNPIENPVQNEDQVEPQSRRTISLRIDESGEIFLDNEKISKDQLSAKLASYQDAELTVSLNVATSLKMGKLADIQELLRENDVRRIKYEQSKLQEKTASSESARERHFREAIFLIESTDIEYTQKSYGELSEKEKTGLLFTDKKVEKNTPDNQLFEQWKNEKEFAIWIDGKAVANTVLANYQPKDFVWWFQSGVKPNARSVRFPQPFQVHLYSPEYFEESFGPNSEMSRPRTNRDTITITQRKMTSMKDLSRYPDPVTAFLQKNARYEKLKASPEASSPEVKQEIKWLFEELESEYSKTPENRKERLKKPIPPSEASSGKSAAATPQDKSSYWSLYSKYETKVNRTGLVGKFSQQEIAQLEKEYKLLDMTFARLSLEDKMQVKKPSFPYAKLTKEGKVAYKKISDLTEEEKKMMGC
jgi:biopolymer transport protein ExbD